MGRYAFLFLSGWPGIKKVSKMFLKQNFTGAKLVKIGQESHCDLLEMIHIKTTKKEVDPQS
jgi:hypothetical protein